MTLNIEAGLALLELIQDIGIPSALHTDGAKELTQGRWKAVCEEYGIKQTITEPYSLIYGRRKKKYYG
jgi:hypothetical protein